MTDAELLERNLRYLKLPFIEENYEQEATRAARKKIPHVGYLSRLIEGEAALRHDRSIKRRIRLARFPVIKTMEQFKWY